MGAPAQSFSLAGDDAIPQTTFLYWRLPSGYLCTHVYRDLDRMSTVLALTQACDGTARDGSLRSRTAAIASSLEAA
jgi:hypothetical protein